MKYFGVYVNEEIICLNWLVELSDFYTIIRLQILGSIIIDIIDAFIEKLYGVKIPIKKKI